MEIGAVVAAAPKEQVKRLEPLDGHIVLLIGGRTGRDGIGGATGSSKSHELKTTTTAGAEVQKGNPVEERKISVEELLEAQKNGTLEECFGTGTAAVISPVGKLRYKDDVMTINGGNIGEISQKLYDTVTGIQGGTVEDKFNWGTVL